MTSEEIEASQSSKCYVHIVAFQDVGLVWSDQRRRLVNGQLATRRTASAATASVEKEIKEEELELATLRELGLPSSFGVSRTAAVSQSSHQPRHLPAQGAAWPEQPSPSSSFLQKSPNHQWQQAIDPITGYPYYYCKALQQTQWDPPEEEYTPAPSPEDNIAWWLPPDIEAKELLITTALEEQQQQQQMPIAMEGVVAQNDDGIVVVEPRKSPYVEAVESYRQHHGWPRATAYIEQEEQQQEEMYASENPDNSDSKTEDILSNLDTHLDLISRGQQQQEGVLVEKPKPRIESTGLLPCIPAPEPGQHMKFGSSSSSGADAGSDDELLKEGPTATLNKEEQEIIETSNISSTDNKPRRKRRRRRKVHDQHGEIVLPPHLHKYWLQRYSFFSEYDRGILIDEEGWYSVTPEVIAWHHAKRLVASMGSQRCLAVDAFGGMGGNSIQLALAGCHVIAIEMDPHKASLLRHNTQVYGVEDFVEVICGDFLKVAPRINADVVVLSPPWGGPEYSRQKEKFDVENMGGNPELGLSKLLELSFSAMGCSSALVWLPKSSSLVQIEQAAAMAVTDIGGVSISSRCEVEIAALNGVTKAMTVYFGTAAKFRGQKQ